jgi:hypothetical protein
MAAIWFNTQGSTSGAVMQPLLKVRHALLNCWELDVKRSLAFS